VKIAIVCSDSKKCALLEEIIRQSNQYSLAWSATHERVGVGRYDSPDLLLLCTDSTQKNCATLLRSRPNWLDCPTLLLASEKQRYGNEVFNALDAGAADITTTPDSLHQGNDLIHKIQGMDRLYSSGKSHHKASTTDHRMLIAVGASTGGPAAILAALKKLPATTAASVLIVQHLDLRFGDGLACWLNEKLAMPVRLAHQGDRPEAGQALLITGDEHWQLTRYGTLQHGPDPEDYPFHPSVNILFSSLARHWQGEAIGLLLSGMGRDGAEGLLQMRQHQWHTITQDQASSTVYGMPKAAVDIGAAVESLPLDAINDRLNMLLKQQGGKDG